MFFTRYSLFWQWTKHPTDNGFSIQITKNRTNADVALVTSQGRSNRSQLCNIARWIVYLLLDPAALGSNNGSGVIPDKIYDVAVLINSALFRGSGKCKAL